MSVESGPPRQDGGVPSYEWLLLSCFNECDDQFMGGTVSLLDGRWGDAAKKISVFDMRDALTKTIAWTRNFPRRQLPIVKGLYLVGHGPSWLERPGAPILEDNPYLLWGEYTWRQDLEHLANGFKGLSAVHNLLSGASKMMIHACNLGCDPPRYQEYRKLLATLWFGVQPRRSDDVSVVSVNGYVVMSRDIIPWYPGPDDKARAKKRGLRIADSPKKEIVSQFYIRSSGDLAWES